MLHIPRFCQLAWRALAVVAVVASSAQADTFVLSSGARLEGKLLNPEQEPRAQYLVELATGAKLALGKSQVRQVVPVSDVEAQYETHLAKMPDTVEGHWKLADWCAKAKLGAHREFHLRTIVERDPQHKEARLALGYTNIDGKWVLPEEHNKSRGYVRFEGHWRTPQEVAIVSARANAQKIDRKWRNDIRMWHGWLKRPSKAAEGMAMFRSIRDPLAAPALVDLLDDKEEPSNHKLEYIEILGPMAPSINYVRGALVNHALYDNSLDVREKCLDYLEKCDRRTVAKMFAVALNDKSNKVVNRAGNGIARMGDKEVIGDLISHLETSHKYMEVSSNGNIGANFGGINGAGGGGLSAGGGGPKIKVLAQKNDGVRSALVQLSEGADFGYDQERWKAWYADSQSPKEFDLRRTR